MVAFALGTNEYVPSLTGPLLINSQTGLLGTPVREQTLIHFDMLLEPSLNVGSSVELISSTADNFNGLYKITAVKHRGMISGTLSGSAITTGEFFYNSALVPTVGS